MSRKSLTIDVARVYDAPPPSDHYRVLVDRLWPRGIRKEALHLDEWMKQIGPSNELRKWFGHDEDRWEEFCRRYDDELSSNSDLVDQLLKAAQKRPLLLLFAARDVQHNNAVALKQYLEKQKST